jgi:hypothetical protein
MAKATEGQQCVLLLWLNRKITSAAVIGLSHFAIISLALVIDWRSAHFLTISSAD